MSNLGVLDTLEYAQSHIKSAREERLLQCPWCCFTSDDLIIWYVDAGESSCIGSNQYRQRHIADFGSVDSPQNLHSGQTQFIRLLERSERPVWVPISAIRYLTNLQQNNI